MDTDSMQSEPMVQQLERLEQMVDSISDTIADVRHRENQLQKSIESQLDILHRIERRLSLGSIVSADNPSKSPVQEEVNKASDGHEDFDEAVGIGTATFLKGWQQQRSEMLSRLGQEDEQEKSTASGTPIHRSSGSDLDISVQLANASAEDIDEIQALKNQLQQAMRDAEIELSMERARLSNERTQLEKKCEAIAAREKELARKSDTEHHSKDKRVSRLMSLLGRNKKSQ